MRIHHLGRTTTGSGLRISRRGHFSRGYAKQISSNQGTGLTGEVFEHSLDKVGDLLRQVTISQPRIPKKYISFDL